MNNEYSQVLTPIAYFSIDALIVYIFLLLLLVVGIYAGYSIQNVRDYAVASRRYGTGMLAITLLAVSIGAGSSTGIAAWIFSHGFVVLPVIFGLSLSPLLVGLVIVPRIVRFDTQALSMAELMGHFFGPQVRVATGLVGGIAATLVVGSQMLALGNIASLLLNIDKFTAIGIAGGVIVAYTTFGGMRAVVMTDVFEFIVIIVMIPLVASLVVSRAGGISEVMHALPAQYFRWFTHERWPAYCAVACVVLLPTLSLSPPFIQRMLMARNHQQIQRILVVQSGVTLSFLVMIALIALTAVVLYPSLVESDFVLPHVINEVMPAGLKGLSIVGLFAIMMSTADNFLNTGSLFIAHDIVIPWAKRNQGTVDELSLSQVIAMLLGVSAMLVAYISRDVIALNVLAMSLFACTITVPFIAGILGVKCNQSAFFGAAFIALLILAGAGYSLPPTLRPFAVLLSMVGNAIAFLTIHYLVNGRFVVIKTNWGKEEYVSLAWVRWLLRKLWRALPLPHHIYAYTQSKVQRYGSNHILFSTFFCLNYIAPVFMWTHEEPTHYQIMVLMRFVGGLLCVGLLLASRWTMRMRKFFPVYWFFTLTFCLPFMATAMYVLMRGTTEWLVNVALVLLLLAWLVDWLSFLLISIIGGSLGFVFGLWYISYSGVSPWVTLSSDFSSLYLLAYTYAFSSLIGVVFFRKKEHDISRQLTQLKMLGGAVAHEVKNVVGLNKSYASVLDMYMHSMEASSKTGNQDKEGENTPITLATTAQTYDTVLETLQSMKKANARSIATINRMLVNMQTQVATEDFEVLPIVACIEEALADYELRSDQRKNITLNFEEPFEFRGSAIYFKQIIFNLLNNAYNYGREDCKIKITLRDKALCFEDDGPGIPSHILPDIFDYFYTTSTTGTGIGLGFCKRMMEFFGGDIHCETQVEGETFTRFVLKFPPAH